LSVKKNGPVRLKPTATNKARGKGILGRNLEGVTGIRLGKGGGY